MLFMYIVVGFGKHVFSSSISAIFAGVLLHFHPPYRAGDFLMSFLSPPSLNPLDSLPLDSGSGGLYWKDNNNFYALRTSNMHTPRFPRSFHPAPSNFFIHFLLTPTIYLHTLNPKVLEAPSPEYGGLLGGFEGEIRAAVAW